MEIVAGARKLVLAVGEVIFTVGARAANSIRSAYCNIYRGRSSGSAGIIGSLGGYVISTGYYVVPVKGIRSGCSFAQFNSTVIIFHFAYRTICIGGIGGNVNAGRALKLLDDVGDVNTNRWARC